MTDYTLPGILHYLQSEWRRFESLRNEWQIEKSDLQEQLTLLKGEKTSLEIINADLNKRIKMLEYALFKERKNEKSSEVDNVEKKENPQGDNTHLYLPFTKSSNNSRSKEILKNYLREANQLLALSSNEQK